MISVNKIFLIKVNTKFSTLDEFTIQQLRMFPGGTGELKQGAEGYWPCFKTHQC